MTITCPRCLRRRGFLYLDRDAGDPRREPACLACGYREDGPGSQTAYAASTAGQSVTTIACPSCGVGLPALRNPMWCGRCGYTGLETVPVSRNTDPETSREAEDWINASGQRETQAAIVMRLVQYHPGLTAGEIGERTGLGHVPAQRRLSDLKAAGLVVTAAPRRYRDRRQVTWWPATTQGGLL